MPEFLGIKTCADKWYGIAVEGHIRDGKRVDSYTFTNNCEWTVFQIRVLNHKRVKAIDVPVIRGKASEMDLYYTAQSGFWLQTTGITTPLLE